MPWKPGQARTTKSFPSFGSADSRGIHAFPAAKLKNHADKGSVPQHRRQKGESAHREEKEKALETPAARWDHVTTVTGLSADFGNDPRPDTLGHAQVA